MYVTLLAPLQAAKQEDEDLDALLAELDGAPPAAAAAAATPFGADAAEAAAAANGPAAEAADAEAADAEAAAEGGEDGGADASVSCHSYMQFDLGTPFHGGLSECKDWWQCSRRDKDRLAPV